MRTAGLSADVAMPKATMDKDGHAELRQHQVWFTRQILTMQAVSEARGVERLSDEPFGAGVPTANGRHIAATRFRRRNQIEHAH